jgi:hypothetical protein
MGSVYEVVYANQSSQEPSQGEMEAWIEQYDLYNNTLMPGASDGSTILNAFERRECTYLVETGCMTVLHKNCTCTNGACTTSAELTLAELSIALGG